VPFASATVACALLANQVMAPIAQAGTSPQTVTATISVNVLDDCSVQGAAGPPGWSLDFGTYQLGAPASAAFATTLYCTKGTIVNSVTLDGGLNYFASSRHMSDGASHLLPYKIYVTPCTSRSVEWSGASTPAAFQSVTAASVRSPLGGSACGTIDAGSNEPAGFYSDIVTLTVNFT